MQLNLSTLEYHCDLHMFEYANINAPCFLGNCIFCPEL